MLLHDSLIRALTQLQAMVNSIPAAHFAQRLAPDMLPLADQAKIAANFMLRGYLPLLGLPVIYQENSLNGKESVQKHLADTQTVLQDLPKITSLDTTDWVMDTAGMADIHLPQPQYIEYYILPNMYFHISMVYAIARQCGVPFSKGDFDGLHQYPVGFSFVGE